MAQYSVSRQAKFGSDNIHEVVMIADKDGNILNTAGSASNIPIAGGEVTGYSHINKFGFNSAVGTGFEVVTDTGGTQSYPSSATVATITSSSGATDSGVEIEVQGLDSNYNQITETVTLDASGTKDTVAQFIRVFRMIANTSHVGNISVTVDSIVIDTMPAGAGQTLMAIYTVPAGKTAYLLKFQGNVEKDTGTIFRILARPFGGAFNVKGQYGTFGSAVTFDFPVPLVFTEKTDIETQVKAQGTTGAGAIFDLILVDN